MDKALGNFAALIVLVLLLSYCVFSAQRDTPAEPLPSRSAKLTPAKCQQAKDSLARVLAKSGPETKNPNPGQLYLRPADWTTLDGANREGIFGLLAYQKACAQSLDPLYVTVEVRNIYNNEMLASGTMWNIKDN